MAGCLGRIREAVHSMSPAEHQVAEYVLEHPEKTALLSVKELAAASKTSTASVLRMCRQVGLNGYRDFIRLLASDIALQQNGDITFSEIHPNASLDAIANSVVRNSTYALENTLSMLDMAELQRAVDLLCRAKRIDFYGVGVSGIVASDAYTKFLRTSTPCNSTANPHMQLLTAMNLSPKDAAVLISYSGTTKDMLTLADLIRKQGTPIISITQCGTNPLASAADICLYTTAFEPLVRSGPMTSRLSQMIVLDILYISVCSTKYNKVRDSLEASQELMATMHST